MAAKSAIEWTESTWNPVTGCSKVSPGCANCYAERLALRLQAMGHKNYARGFKPATHERTLSLPLGWKTPQVIFVNSMSDLFHDKVPLTFIKKVFAVMNEANWHQFQVLTKRSQRLLELSHHLPWAEHIWMGVSVETQDYVHRIDDLRETDAHIKFLSLEPLLGPLPKLNLKGIDWVIVGGESGLGAACKGVGDGHSRPVPQSQVPFFFKQWGGLNKKKNGLLQGRTWDQMPVQDKVLEGAV